MGRSWMMRSRRVTRSNRAESVPNQRREQANGWSLRNRHRCNAPDAGFDFAVHRGRTNSTVIA